MVGAIWRVSTVPVTVAGDIRMLETSNMTLPSSFANPPCSATFAFPPVGAIEKEIQGWSGEDFAAADERLLDLPLGHRSRDLRGIRQPEQRSVFLIGLPDQAATDLTGKTPACCKMVQPAGAAWRLIGRQKECAHF